MENDFYKKYAEFNNDEPISYIVIEFENGEIHKFPFGSKVGSTRKCIDKYRMKKRNEKIDKIINGK